MLDFGPSPNKSNIFTTNTTDSLLTSPPEKMADPGDDDRRRKISLELFLRCIISGISGTLTQLSLLIIPNFFSSFSLLSQLLLSAMVFVLVIGFSQFCRRVIGIRASAPIFVLFHVIFIWVVYIAVIRQAVSSIMDIILNGELALLLIGFFRILASDPGFVRHDSSTSLEESFSADTDCAEEPTFSVTASSTFPSMEATSLSSRRVRYCRSCKAFVRGFDHHCPAFGNCIGQKNYALFMILLFGFATTEASYAICSYQWVKRSHNFNMNNVEINLYESLAVSTMLFSLLQVIWQVVFLAWHIYCICLNITTDEWINWRKYPEFHVISQLSLGHSEVRFMNPYNRGIVHNLKDFLLIQG